MITSIILFFVIAFILYLISLFNQSHLLKYVSYILISLSVLLSIMM